MRGGVRGYACYYTSRSNHERLLDHRHLGKGMCERVCEGVCERVCEGMMRACVREGVCVCVIGYVHVCVGGCVRMYERVCARVHAAMLYSYTTSRSARVLGSYFKSSL